MTTSQRLAEVIADKVARQRTVPVTAARCQWTEGVCRIVIVTRDGEQVVFVEEGQREF